LLYESPSERKRIGAAGASTVATYYSSAAAGAVAKARLVQIDANLRARRHKPDPRARRRKPDPQ
jgi:hypothetical protein